MGTQVSVLHEAEKFISLVARWDELSDEQKSVERAKGNASAFRQVPMTTEPACDGFEVEV